MQRSRLKLSPALRRWFYAAFAALFLTGVAWLILDRLSAGDPDAPQNPLQPWLLKLHGAAAMVALAILGALLPTHVKPGWKRRLNRPAGIGLTALCALLAATGYALYYAGDDALRRVATLAHDIVGLGFPVVLVWHVVAGRRAKSAAGAQTSKH